MSTITGVIEFVKKSGRPVRIQTHNFPDHDAVASAYGLQQLLLTRGLEAQIVYEGEVQRDSLKQMIAELSIAIRAAAAAELAQDDLIIVVDGCKGNKNVTDLVGEEIAVIDHHEVQCPEDVRFCDIRPDHGACATIIQSYYAELGETPAGGVATALMAGICMDTALLTRGVSEADIQAYADLFPLADVGLLNSILRNYIQTKDLSFYRYALEHVEIRDGLAFCHFPEGCNQNLLGVLGDFFLALREISFVVLCARNDSVINLSVRNERSGVNAAQAIQEVLQGMGFGGGHADMAGGIIKDPLLFHPEKVQNKFRAVLQSQGHPA